MKYLLSLLLTLMVSPAVAEPTLAPIAQIGDWSVHEDSKDKSCYILTRQSNKSFGVQGAKGITFIYVAKDEWDFNPLIDFNITLQSSLSGLNKVVEEQVPMLTTAYKSAVSKYSINFQYLFEKQISTGETYYANSILIRFEGSEPNWEIPDLTGFERLYDTFLDCQKKQVVTNSNITLPFDTETTGSIAPQIPIGKQNPPMTGSSDSMRLPGDDLEAEKRGDMEEAIRALEK